MGCVKRLARQATRRTLPSPDHGHNSTDTSHCKKRWKRFTDQQEAGEGAKPKQPPSTKKSVKRANDDEETPSKKPKKSTEADEEDKEKMLAAEDDVNEEERI